MNKVILMGRLVADPEIRDTGKGKDALAVANFTLAVDRGDKDHTADFIRCVAFGARANFISEYFIKGQRALVEGRWQTGHYENEHKETVYTNDCYVSNIEFADSKKEEPEEDKKRSRRR